MSFFLYGAHFLIVETTSELTACSGPWNEQGWHFISLRCLLTFFFPGSLPYLHSPNPESRKLLYKILCCDSIQHPQLWIPWPLWLPGHGTEGFLFVLRIKLVPGDINSASSAQEGQAHLKGFHQDGVSLAFDQGATATVTKGNHRAQTLEGTS